MLAGISPQPPEKKSLQELHPGGGGHPVIPAPAEDWPAPQAEDVASTESIIAAYYASTAGEPGQPRDWNRFRSLFLPRGHLAVARPRGDGSTGAFVLTPDDYVQANQKYFEKGGFLDREVARRSESYGNMSHVWSTYESRRSKNDPAPYSRGIASFQLLKDGNRWWIVSVFWDSERPDSPIPEKYTQTVKE